MSIPELEEKILEFWRKKKIFERSVRQNKRQPYFSFYDGPPFANGEPHYGHILASAIKDTVLRFWTMMGYRIDRRVGWDCHGLPVENLIEKELGVKTKKDIEKKIGIQKFNEACRKSVFRYVEDFQKILQRFGRWADYKHYYATMDSSYTESVWWVFKNLYDKGLVYQDYRVGPYCSRCGTPLSNFEVNQGYKEVEDVSLYVKFPLRDEKNTYFLVWTTTPWTLPANLAVAVNPKFTYVKVALEDQKNHRQFLILAKERLNIVKGDYKIVRVISGKDLIGLRYQPLYAKPSENLPVSYKEKIHRVVGANFVSLDEGTGLVHIAPAFGEDDREVGKKEGLPLIITVDLEGKVVQGLSIPGEGKFVKQADEDIERSLESRGFVYKTEKIKHIYPFCYRCDTPLLYYPLKSWYVKVTAFKKALVDNNEKIHWVPEYIKHGRFGKWLAGAKDWCVSRNRYWGAPIPVWICEKCHRKIVIGSKKELGKYSFTSNYYFLLRHGESTCHREKKMSNDFKSDNCHLTPMGKKQIRKVALALKKERIDFIISSDFLRTRETAEIVAGVLGCHIIYDKHLRDLDVGIMNKADITLVRSAVWAKDNLDEPLFGEESRLQLWQRIKDFFDRLEKEYQGKRILIVGHSLPLIYLWGILRGEGLKDIIRKKPKFQIAQLKKTSSKIFPFNQKGEIDFHRPYIDNIVLKCPHCGQKAYRTPEVFDCWFESGSMPYAQWHYPFENRRKVKQTFPADFIAEGLDQTRGWFYTLHVLATALTLRDIGLGKNKPAFKNAVCNGLILGQDKKKLSKRLKNYSPPEEIFRLYGADALRYFLLASTPLGQDYIFDKKKVAEIFRKIILTIWNSLKFLQTYLPQDFEIPQRVRPQSVLDKWILSRLGVLERDVISEMRQYHITQAARMIGNFVDDLSNWYIRRSRARLQKNENSGEAKEAGAILGFVLLRFSQIAAPVMPFLSEAVFQELLKFSKRKLPLSVHLTRYPQGEVRFILPKLEKKMRLLREITTQVLALRAKKGIKIRQPLAKLTLKKDVIGDKSLWQLLKEETNIKNVVFNPKARIEISLSTKLTKTLREEGFLRELLHQVGVLRKKAGLSRGDKASLVVNGDKSLLSLISSKKDLISKEGFLESLSFSQKVPSENSYLWKEIEMLGKKVVIYLIYKKDSL